MRFANVACGLFIYLFTILMSATVNKCTGRGLRRRVAEVGTETVAEEECRGSGRDCNCSGK